MTVPFRLAVPVLIGHGLTDSAARKALVTAELRGHYTAQAGLTKVTVSRTGRKFTIA